MSPRMGRARPLRRFAATGAAIALGLLGCQDAPLTGTPTQEPPRVDARQGALLSGQVAADGSVTFDPVAAPAAARLAPGVSAAIYGDQNVTVRLYSTELTIDSTSVPGRKRWSFSVGLRNYLDFPIGSNQGGAQPTDTLGVYVVLVADPMVTSTSGPCSGSSCAIRVDSTTDGVANFTAPNQKYYYWRERLAARQPVAGADTTSVRKRWVFTGPASITGFRFSLMVSAAWPPPHDASWNVFYDAATDSLPDTQAEPRWKRYVLPGYLLGQYTGTATWSSGGLVLKSSAGQNLHMVRSDSLGPAESAYIAARVDVNGSGSGDSPGATFGLIDSDHLIAVGVSDGEVGFVDLKWDMFLFFLPHDFHWEYVGSTHTLPNGGGRTAHTYLLRKFGADSVRLELDGVRVLGMRVSQLPDRPGDSGAISAFFGVSGHRASPTSTWPYITYNFGTTQP